MRVFLTGGSGFIGSRVTRRLVENQHDVIVLVRATSRTHRIDDLEVRRVVGDMHDPEPLIPLMEESDVCIHMASVSGWDLVVGDGVERSVLEGTRSMVNTARRAGIGRFVYVSSSAAVNGSSEPVVFGESSPFELDPCRFRYAGAKLQAESLVLAASDQRMETVVVNPVETFGPDDVDEITAGTIRRFLTDWPVVVVPGGTSIAHVDDVADGIVAAMGTGRPGHRYLLGGDNVTIADLARLSLKLARRRAPVLTLPRRLIDRLLPPAVALGMLEPVSPELLDYASMYWYTSSDKAERELGYRWRPAAEVLAPVVSWLQEGH